MRVGYLMNTYPLVSTTFIGREIQALERLGLDVRRYAVRPWSGQLVDPGDQAEKEKTEYLLANRRRIAFSIVRELFRSPLRFFRTAGLALRLLRNAGGGTVRHAAYLAEATVLRGLAERDGITHLHAHFSTNATTVAMLVQELGGPSYSFTVHGPDELLTPVQNSTAEKVARARFVACISHFARSQVMLFSDEAHWSKLAIVHCGVIPSDYGKKPHGPYGKRILFIGRLAPVKGASLLLEAVASVQQDHPDLTLTIVGDGPERQKLEAKARNLGLADKTRFTGYLGHKAIADILEQSDMLVLPSFAEGVPVVLMEAMASRLPVVASRIAGIPELVEDGVSGILVPPGDIASLREALGTILGDLVQSALMGAAGQAKVQRGHSVDVEAHKLAGAFRSSRLP